MREGFTDAGDLSAMVRLESTAARAVRALNIAAITAATKTPRLADYLAKRAAEKAAHASKGDAA